MNEPVEFKRIHAVLRPKIHRYLMRLIGESEAEDLTQEVFVKVSQSLKTFRGESQISTWVYRIATNAAIDKMRSCAFRQDAQTSSIDDLLATRVGESLGAELSSLEQSIMRKERYQCFGNFVGNLPAHYRAVIVLSELEGLPNHEIAEILGLRLDAVKIRLHRGRAKLFQELRVHCKAEDWL